MHWCRETAKDELFKTMSVSNVVHAYGGFRHRSMYHAISHSDYMHVDQSGIGTDLLDVLIANLTPGQLKLVNT